LCVAAATAATAATPLCSYTEDAPSGAVTVHFNTSKGNDRNSINTDSSSSSSSSSPSQVSASLLVAADGYFSRVRRQCLDDGPPEYRSTVIWRARLSAAAAAAAGFKLLDNSVFVSDTGRFMLMYPITSGDVVWTFGATGGQGSLSERQ
jgi:2-polyprenyl-6-methoxyphenol hydroxylase-like FAD-dependent oxidoreductase